MTKCSQPELLIKICPERKASRNKFHSYYMQTLHFKRLLKHKRNLTDTFFWGFVQLWDQTQYLVIK